jgi:integrase
MASLTGLFKRGGSFYLRIVLPKHHPLLSKYANGHFVQTLGACSHREAVRRGTIKRAEVLAGLQLTTTAESAVRAPEAPQAASLKMRDVYGLWKAAKVRSADSVNSCGRALALYEQHTDNPPLRKLTRAQGDAFRAWLQQQGTSSKTARDRLTWVKSLLKYAYRDLEAIDRHPWEGLDIEFTTENKRRPWTDDELTKFFGEPLFTRYELPKARKAGGAAAYWIPLLGLYLGARVGELAQLTVKDIDTEGDVPTLSITDEGADQKVKTSAGVRTVPIHSELIRLGFLDYVRGLRDSGEALLWPTLPRRGGKPGGFFSAWFGDTRRALGIGALPDFHCLRHTVRTQLVEAEVSEPIIDRLIGHEVTGSTGAKTYSHPKAILRRAVELVKYPVLKLDRVLPR